MAIETVRGTAVNPTYSMPYAKMSFHDVIMSAAEDQGMGNIADQDSFYVTMTAGEGDVDNELYDQGIGYILSSLLGAKPVTTGSNPYTHTFTMSQSNLPTTLSLYWKDPDRSYMFNRATVESLKISIVPNGKVEYTIHFKSEHANDWASQTPSFTTLGTKFLHQHLQFRLASSVGGLSAATAISLKSLDMTFNRSTIFDEVMGTAEPEDILSTTMGIEGTLQLNLEDDTYRNYMLNNTYRAMEFKLLASANSSITMQFPRVNFSSWEPDYTINDIAKQKINFKMNYDSVNALDIVSSAVLINQKISY